MLCALLLGPWMSACGSPDADVQASAVRDSAGVVIHDVPESILDESAGPRVAAEPAVRIGVVEGRPEYQWTQPVAGGRLSDGGFVVLGQAPPEVRVFDASGSFERRVGQGGDGPGEFRTPTGLAVMPGDTLVVWDQGAQRLTWFSPTGAFVRDRALREPGGVRTIRRVALGPGGESAVLGPTMTEEDWGRENDGRMRERWLVVAVSDTGRVGEAIGEVPGTERVLEVARTESGAVESVRVSGRWWWGEGFAWADRNGVWTTDQLTLEARHFDFDAGLDRIVRVDAGPRPFTGALIDSLHRVELARVSDPDLGELWRADFEDRSYPPHVPPVAGVFADRLGRVWIGLTDPPPESLVSGVLKSIRRWVVFTPVAETEASTRSPGLASDGILELPARSHPLWADAEGVMVLRVGDEFNVPFIEWYPFVGADDVEDRP